MAIISSIRNSENLISQIQVALCFGMFVGFNYSRALLSISIVLLCLLTLSIKPVKATFKLYIKEPYNIVCALYFLSICISGLWSSNYDSWLESVLNALPFVALPLSFTAMPLNNKSIVKNLILGIVIIMSSGVVYTLINYFLEIKRFGWWTHHFESVPSMPHDYIRHTIGVAISVLMVFYAIIEKSIFNWNRIQQIILWLGAFLGFVLIHLQIAKTGLLVFYTCLAIIFVWKLFSLKNKVIKIGFVLMAGCSFFLIINTNIFKQGIATLQRELRLLEQVTAENYITTSSYLPRIVSFSYALEAIQEHPILGVGIGDVKDEMTKKYAQKMPDLHQQYVLIPHNQYLYNALGLGIPMSLLTIFMLLLGYSYKRIDVVNICAVAIGVSFMLLCLIESVLVVQMSIFIYLFFTLFFKSLLQKKHQFYTD